MRRMAVFVRKISDSLALSLECTPREELNELGLRSITIPFDINREEGQMDISDGVRSMKRLEDLLVFTEPCVD